MITVWRFYNERAESFVQIQRQFGWRRACRAIRDFSEAELQAVGAGAVNQSVKAIAIASGFLAPSGMLLFAQPSFEAIEIDGEERTAIRFKVTSQKI